MITRLIAYRVLHRRARALGLGFRPDPPGVLDPLVAQENVRRHGRTILVAPCCPGVRASRLPFCGPVACGRGASGHERRRALRASRRPRRGSRAPRLHGQPAVDAPDRRSARSSRVGGRPAASPRSRHRHERHDRQALERLVGPPQKMRSSTSSRGVSRWSSSDSPSEGPWRAGWPSSIAGDARHSRREPDGRAAGREPSRR